LEIKGENIMPKLKNVVFMLLVFQLLISQAVYAQSNDDFSISLNRDFGYGGFGNDIQGLFTIEVHTGLNLDKVQFVIDESIIGEVTDAPYKFQFQTGNFSLGVHNIFAVGILSTGAEVSSNVIVAEFVSPEQGWQSALKIIVPIFGLILGGMLLSALLPVLMRKKSKSTNIPISFGPLGGTICSNCGLPFSIHLWGLNVVVGKLDRCPHCGKWSLVHRVHPAELALAVEKLKPVVPPISISETEEERTKKEIEESKYLD
jgi:hypothetical protein